MIIYKITNKLNGRCYIGQTTKSLKERWAEHCLPSSRCYALSGAIKKYGKESFTIEHIRSYDSRQDLGNAEEYYISYYDCMAPHGYNLTSGGLHTVLSETSRQKSSLTHKKRIAEGKSPWLPKKGESRSPATQFKKGQNNRKGIKLTPEQIQHMKNCGAGFKKGQVAPNKGRKKFVIDGKIRYLKVQNAG